jgi:hypothetical protein
MVILLCVEIFNSFVSIRSFRLIRGKLANYFVRVWSSRLVGSLVGPAFWVVDGESASFIGQS